MLFDVVFLFQMKLKYTFAAQTVFAHGNFKTHRKWN